MERSCANARGTMTKSVPSFIGLDDALETGWLSHCRAPLSTGAKLSGAIAIDALKYCWFGFSRHRCVPPSNKNSTVPVSPLRLK